MLWLALQFPQLPIDRRPGGDVDEPLVVVLQEGPRRRILACNEAAAAAGIHSGLALKSAYAIVPDLVVNEYDEDEQQQHLEQLTLWALSYSSWITPHAPNTVLIEIQASLKLFGGLEALLKIIREDVQHQALTVRMGVAPTPSAAQLFATAGQSTPVRSRSALGQVLAPIPVEYLPLDAFTFKGLRQSGIRQIGQLMRLPAASLTRRFGNTCMDLLYKLDGRLPEPQQAFVPPKTFSQAADLPLEAPDTNALAFPLNRLLSALGGFLRASDLGVRHLDIQLYHHKQAPTVVTLRFLDATASSQHLFRIATERLGNTVLSSPVIRIRLDSQELAPIERGAKDLFQKSQAQASSIQQVLDNLMARLGRDALYTALPGDDHRPEKAWLSALLQETSPPVQWPARPTWLLKEPRLACEDLELTTLPERIENGWWDETDVRRDYYIAHDRKGSHYWVYRQRNDPHNTWIHGIFS